MIARPTDMATAEIKREIAEREAWQKRVSADPDFGCGGSPFEWHYERLSDLDAELRARLKEGAVK